MTMESAGAALGQMIMEVRLETAGRGDGGEARGLRGRVAAPALEAAAGRQALGGRALQMVEAVVVEAETSRRESPRWCSITRAPWTC